MVKKSVGSETENEAGASVKFTVSRSDDEHEIASSEDEGRHGKRKGATSSASRKKRVMDESGQTDVERRELRNSQRELQKRIADNMEEDVDTIAAHRAENNKLWQKVSYVREAVLDGDTLDIIGNKASRQISALIQIPRYDASRLAHKLKNKCTIPTSSGTKIFDWKTFGIECGSCFNAVPVRVCFMAGPLQTSPVHKERKKPVRKAKVKDDGDEEESPEDVNQTKGSNKDNNNLAAAEKNMNDASKILHRKCKEAKQNAIEKLRSKGLKAEELSAAERRLECHGDKICAVKFLFNPKSFTQTVENIFTMSFMVKKNSAAIGVHDAVEGFDAGLSVMPGPWIRSLKREGDEEAVEARQAIVSLTMKDWRRLCEAFQVDSSDIPDRTHGRIKNHTKVEI